MADEKEKPEAPEQDKKPKKTSDLVVRIVLIVVLALVVIMFFLHRGLVKEYRSAVTLYEAGKYQEAHDVLAPLVKSPLSIIKIRGEARRTLGLCKAEMATEIVYSDQTLEGYTKALKLIEEARELVGPNDEIDRRIKEYGEYKAKAEKQPEPVKPPPAAEPAE